jgi:Ni,Fe-hydrogenase III component G
MKQLKIKLLHKLMKEGMKYYNNKSEFWPMWLLAASEEKEMEHFSLTFLSSKTSPGRNFLFS